MNILSRMLKDRQCSAAEAKEQRKFMNRLRGIGDMHDEVIECVAVVESVEDNTPDTLLNHQSSVYLTTSLMI